MDINDFDAFWTGRDNGHRGRLVYESLPMGADAVQRALCLAGFELARIKRKIGAYPVPIHSGQRWFWLVGQDSISACRPVYQATDPDAIPEGDGGYYDLRALFRLKGEPQHGVLL